MTQFFSYGLSFYPILSSPALMNICLALNLMSMSVLKFKIPLTLTNLYTGVSARSIVIFQPDSTWTSSSNPGSLPLGQFFASLHNLTLPSVSFSTISSEHEPSHLFPTNLITLSFPSYSTPFG